ncbi:hypothetical protein K7432_005827 [Basidiobolus ranarum]|uniref:G-protein coupled receptors family 1 profile domain-containing protein n=1 Tax=Basidiobolus ranarum TaxID=34480 RepID=A0ABR2WW01_9FUNG
MDTLLNRLLSTTIDIVQVTSICSTVATGFVVITGISLLSTRRQITNKVSFKLALFVAFYELVFHIANIVNTHVLVYSMAPTISCRVIRSVANFSKLMAVFTTATIAYNLDMILIRQRNEVKRAQLWYVPFALSIALVITLICSIYSIATGVCWLADFALNPSAGWIQWLSSYLWMLLGLVYSLYVVIRVIRLLGRHETDMHMTMEKYGRTISQKLRRVSFRITMYVVVPILTFLPSILSFTIQTIGYSVASPVYKKYISTLDAIVWIIAELLASSTGVLTALVFVFDPVVTAALVDFLEYAKDRLKCNRGQTNSV